MFFIDLDREKAGSLIIRFERKGYVKKLSEFHDKQL
jgi:hypothetical protein